MKSFESLVATSDPYTMTEYHITKELPSMCHFDGETGQCLGEVNCITHGGLALPSRDCSLPTLCCIGIL